MPTLYIDLGSAHPVFALVDDVRTLGALAIVDHKDEAALMPALESILRDCACGWGDIDRIALMEGPGGFMSLRVGAALANALAFALDVSTAGIHGSEVWRARMLDCKTAGRKPAPLCQNTIAQGSSFSSCGGRSFLWLHSTKRDLLFIRGFGTFADQWPEPVLIGLDALSPALSRGERGDGLAIPYVGELITEHQKILTGIQLIDDVKPLEEVLPELLIDLEYQKKTLLPWYGREA